MTYLKLKQDEAVSQAHLDAAGAALLRTQASIARKKKLKWVYIALWVYMLLAYIGGSLLWIWLPSAKRKGLQTKLMRHLWAVYFGGTGVTHYETSPFPETPPKPMLIFSSRSHTLSALFIYRLFKFPLVIPLVDAMRRFRLMPGLPFGFITRLFPLISYPDSTLANDLDTVKKILTQGYSVVVFANPYYLDTSLMTHMPIHEEIGALLEDPDPTWDTYFLNIDGIERFPFSTFASPIQIRCHLIKKEDLFYLVPPEEKNFQYQRIAQFFGFADYTIVR